MAWEIKPVDSPDYMHLLEEIEGIE